MKRKEAQILAEVADYYYDVCGLHEDDDLDPDDHLKVIQAAFSSSDCDDFSYIVHLMTGWQVVRATWMVPNQGFGHHSLIRAPDGQLFDVCGYTTEDDLKRRYLGSRQKSKRKLTLTDVDAAPLSAFDMTDDQGIEGDMKRIASAIRLLPYPPFTTEAFRILGDRPLPGVDVAAISPHDGCPTSGSSTP